MKKLTLITILSLFVFNFIFGQDQEKYAKLTKDGEEVIGIVELNKEKAKVNLDKTLVALLDTVLQNDQKYRQELRWIEEKYGRESEEMKAQWKIISQQDSINLIIVKKILDERGWLGADVIGGKGTQALFLVIQHSNLEIQDKYLPMMREAVSKGSACASMLAFLEDRVALEKNEKQIYGSQIGQNPETGEYYLQPLIDPDNVDKRRADVGLDSIQNYISNWGLTWDVEEYKKKLSEYENTSKYL